jgi:4-amino-4-deoxy-L-arabinose transferase-like glycosyltransferase
VLGRIAAFDGAHVNIARLGGVITSPLLVVSAVALALRLINLGGAALWYDESGSAWMASLPFQGMVAATAGDTHPPLYLALLWAWVRIFGLSEFSVRLPSVIIGALCVPLAYLLARRLKFSNTVALVGAALAAIAPIQIHYSQEARMYALLQFEFLVALLAVLSWRWWLFGLMLTAMYWTHNYGLIYVVPLNVIAIYQVYRQSRSINKPVFASPPLMWWTWMNIIAAAAWLPWLSALAGQMREVSGGYWIQPPTLGSVLYSLYLIVWGFSTPDTLEAHASLLLFGALAFALYRAVRDNARRGNPAEPKPGALPALGIAVMVLSPFALVVAASAVWRPILLPRAFLPVSVPLYLLLAWTFVEGVNWRRRWLVGLLAAPALAASLMGYYLFIGDNKGHPQELVSQVNFRPGDVVFHVNEGTLMITHFYTPGDWPQYMLRPTWHNLGGLSEPTREALQMQIAALGDVQWHRAWLLYSGAPTTVTAEDAAVKDILSEYTHQTVWERIEPMTHQAIYLLWNHGVGVP